MAALASNWLKHFRFLLRNRWTEFNENWQEARSQHPLPSLCFLDRSEKQDGRAGLLLAEIFSTSPLKQQNGIQRNLTGSKITTSSTKFVFFGPIEKKKKQMAARPLIGWDIFEFSSETAELNPTKPDRNQDLNVLFQICVFFSGWSEKIKWPPWPLIIWEIFDFSETAEQNSTKLYRKQDFNVLYQVCGFWTDRKNNMAALASHWLRHFQLFLWNRWTEFVGTWPEPRSKQPSQNVGVLFCRFEKQYGRPASDLKHFRLLLWNCRTEFNETLQDADLNVLYQVCNFCQSEKQDGDPGLWFAVAFFNISSETAEPNETEQEARSQLHLPSLCFRADRKNKVAALAILSKRGTLYSGARYVAL